jgi:rhodanese-related sulfurtransferase
MAGSSPSVAQDPDTKRSRRISFEIGKASILLVSSALLAGLTIWIHPARKNLFLLASIPRLSLEKLSRLDGNQIWIDARPRSEFENEHIPGAYSLEESRFEEGIDAVLKVWKPGVPLIVYCSSNSCNDSTKVALRLRDFGLDPVYILKGGWQDWQAQ